VDPNESSQVTDRAVLVLSPVEGSCIRKHMRLEGDIDDMIQRRPVGKIYLFLYVRIPSDTSFFPSWIPLCLINSDLTFI
jgi:hypothetical protein